MRVGVVFSEAARSLRASMSTTVAATLTVLIGMFVLGLTIALGTWVLSWSDHVKKQLLVKAYFTDTATPRQEARVGNFIRTDDRVASEYAKVQRLYNVQLKMPDRCQIEYFVGPHKINGVGTFEFLHKHLKWPKPGASEKVSGE